MVHRRCERPKRSDYRNAKSTYGGWRRGEVLRRSESDDPIRRWNCLSEIKEVGRRKWGRLTPFLKSNVRRIIRNLPVRATTRGFLILTSKLRKFRNDEKRRKNRVQFAIFMLF